MDKVDKLYYINLKKRVDRREHFKKECEKVGIPETKIVRFEAFDGSDYEFKEEDLKLFTKANYIGKSFEKKVIGNQLSHFYILKEMIEKNYNYIIIVQDDVVFRNGFLDYIEDIMNHIPENSEIINIGFHTYAYYAHFVAWDLEADNDIEKLGSPVNDFICQLNHNINPCSLAYIVTRDGALQLVDYFEKNGFLEETDHNYNRYLKQKNIYYGSSTVLCTGNPGLGSDIF
jgi:GR25 family glycosyltransferase involved in LPS biosynthesis